VIRTAPVRALAATLVLAALVLAAGPLALAQSSDLHPHIDGRTYRDDRISVQAPVDWTLSLDQQDLGAGQVRTRGVILRQGRYILHLCTGCAQVSGVVGGRFAEIALMVQPWFRSDPGANPLPCGEPAATHASAKLDRVDLWFRRDPAHHYSDETDDCRAPRTTDPVWYGSYFAERCSHAISGQDCGGYFLHLDWLTRHNNPQPTPSEEMAFALTADADSPDAMPLQTDPDLARVLREASAIVASVRFAPPPKR
jgi:hypothetical protein